MVLGTPLSLRHSIVPEGAVAHHAISNDYRNLDKENVYFVKNKLFTCHLFY